MKKIIFRLLSGVVADALQRDITNEEVQTLSESEFCIYVPEEADKEECRADVENLLAGAGLYCGQHYEFI